VAEGYVKTEQVGYTSDMTTVLSTKALSGVYSSYSQNTSHIRVSGMNSLNGVKNPKWRSQVRLGQNATTPCSGTLYEFEPSFITAGYSYSSKVTPNVVTEGEWYGHQPMNLPASQIAPASIVTEVHNRCIRKFISACESARSSVEAGQDFGEYKQTIEGMIRPMSSMRKTITDHYERLSKANRRFRAWDVPSRTKALADSYLEWTFGVKPLALDIADAYAGLKMRHNRMTNIQPVSAKASGYFAGTNQSFNTAGQALNVLGNKQSVSVYKERMKGGYKIGLVNGSLPVLAVLQMQTLADFEVTAWDLLPYSFLIDYFANIGDIIHAATFCAFNLAWGVDTTRTSTTDTYQYHDAFDPVSPSNNIIRTRFCYGGNSIGRVTSFTRNALTPAQLIPEFRISIPTSAKPWVNIAALVLGGSLPLVPFFKR
jgi:hypothetical protein